MRNAGAVQHVKVIVDVARDDGTNEIESVWAVDENGTYRIDNIPFYARGLACGDIVSATQEPDGLLRYTGVVTPSGHSTVRLWIADASNVQQIRDDLRALGCATELDAKRLVAVDVPPCVPYAKIKAFLDDKELAQILEYEEGCLGQE